jgi:DNA-binding MarR family transcriptional regulator
MRHTEPNAVAKQLSAQFAAIYHRCHPTYSVALAHQGVRVLQLIAEEPAVSIHRVADFLNCASNTASELVSRLVRKGLVDKQRPTEDERVVILALTSGGHIALSEHVGLDIVKLAKALAGADVATRAQILAAFDHLLTLVEAV